MGGTANALRVSFWDDENILKVTVVMVTQLWIYWKKNIQLYTAAAAKSLQSCPTLCDPIDGSPPGSSVSGILQARTLEWVAISFFNAWKWKVKVKSLSHVRLLATSWTAAYQAPPSMGFSRQEYCKVVTNIYIKPGPWSLSRKTGKESSYWWRKALFCLSSG